jgi:2-hydroxy-3-oxopropionate reductase
MAKRIGFIGLGTMGKPMAHNLLKAGFELTVCGHVNLVPVEELCHEGATVVDCPREVAQRSEVVITCLPDTAVVEEVVLGPDGVMEGATEGCIVIDMSTISPTATREIASRLAERGTEMLDAPISGGETGAIAGTLAIMVGGKESVFEACWSILEAMGKSIVYVGGHGSAQIIKLCNQVAVTLGQIAAFEAFTLGAKAGLKPEVIQRVLSKTTARSWVIQDKMPRTVLAGNFESGFKLRLMCKDLRLALELAKEMDVPLFALTLAYNLYILVKSQGKGELENSVVSTLYQEAAGIDLSKM